MLLENAKDTFWYNIKETGCDCIHTCRGLKNYREYIQYTTIPKPGHVLFECNNISCKYTYQIDKSMIFINEASIISYLKCPYCSKLNTKLLWVYFEPRLIEQYEEDKFFNYNVHTENRTFNGPLNVYKTNPGPNILSGALLHTHKQHTLFA